MGRIVRGAKLLGKQAGEGLHLVSTGEQGKFLRIGLTQMGQTLFHDGEGLVPFDLLELRITTHCALLATQGPGEAGRGVLLHDPGGALGADDTLVKRVFRVTLYIAHLAITQGDTNATAAGTHITGRVFDFDPALGGLNGVMDY